MSNPTAYFKVIEKDVLIHGKSIFNDIGQASSSWKSGEFEQFGEAVGDIMLLASQDKLEWTQERKAPIQKVDRKDATEFLQGFLESAKVGTFNFSALFQCILNSVNEV